MKPIRTVFISQPMTGLSNDEILSKRDIYFDIVKDILCADEGEILLIDSSVCPDVPPATAYKPLWYLTKSLAKISLANIVAFSPDYTTARGCKIESEAVNQYMLQKEGFERIDISQEDVDAYMKRKGTACLGDDTKR